MTTHDIFRTRIGHLWHGVAACLIIAGAFFTGESGAVSGQQNQQWMQDLGECGTLKNAYGPYDYTNPQHFRDLLPVVENAHFDIGVETFKGHVGKGKKANMVGGDIDYTLRAFPNHHRALHAMVRYNLEGMNEKLRPMHYSPECYFTRALTFKSDDGMVYLIYGYYLHKTKHEDKALTMYQKALELLPDSAEAHYNIGLLYVDRKDYKAAREHARRAYELGHPLPGLKWKLEAVGQWNDAKPQ